jgi:uncharacterized NAD(P)/FAD-binding protein YdhS
MRVGNGARTVQQEAQRAAKGPLTDRSTVAVVGAGFSGVLTAVRLLLAPDGPRVVLIERAPRFGRGAAYSSASPHHLLNVRAINMSAFAEQPSHFLDWLGRSGLADQGQAFVTRDRYGQYLQSILRRAAGDGKNRLVLEHDEVRRLAREGEAWRLELGVGKTVKADAVVLALGNLAPPLPEAADPVLARSRRYAADPWAWDPAAAPADGEVLILGSGLTAIDIALSVHAARPLARMVALSRHGLLPRRHGEATQPIAAEGRSPAGPPADVLGEVRAAAREDWRGAIDALRPHVNSLWRGWSLAQKRSFLRHLRPWWDVHRHRMAPSVADQIDDLQRQGLLEVVAGRLRRLTADGGGIHAAWSPRGGGALVERDFAVAINCTGARADLAACGEPLIESLIAAGLIRADDCALGLDVDSRSRAIGRDGEPTPTLFAIGPIARGRLFEVTSVPDIRIQAAECAGAVLKALASHSSNGAAGARLEGDRTLAELSAFLAQSVDEIDIELASLKFARRVRNAWELRGRRAAFVEIALWLDAGRGR